jgi:acyl-coenzyme A thioesterase PaaI-like protein
MSNLQLFNRLSKLPMGTYLFSKAVCFIAPYFSSIKPHIQTLKTNECSVYIKKRRSVQNHIGTVHAIAMCNMAELAGGLMTDVSIPKDARWIPAGMTVQYIKKAKTHLTAIADGSQIDWSVAGSKEVPVSVKDIHGEEVFSALISMNVKLS